MFSITVCLGYVKLEKQKITLMWPVVWFNQRKPLSQLSRKTRDFASITIHGCGSKVIIQNSVATCFSLLELHSNCLERTSAHRLLLLLALVVLMRCSVYKLRLQLRVMQTRISSKTAPFLCLLSRKPRWRTRASGRTTSKSDLARFIFIGSNKLVKTQVVFSGIDGFLQVEGVGDDCIGCGKVRLCDLQQTESCASYRFRTPRGIMLRLQGCRTRLDLESEYTCTAA